MADYTVAVIALVTLALVASVQVNTVRTSVTDAVDNVFRALVDVSSKHSTFIPYIASHLHAIFIDL